MIIPLELTDLKLSHFYASMQMPVLMAIESLAS